MKGILTSRKTTARVNGTVVTAIVMDIPFKYPALNFNNKCQLNDIENTQHSAPQSPMTLSLLAKNGKYPIKNSSGCTKQ